jgi:hypothetical protein
VLVGSLIVMVMFSGYENFVSRIDWMSPGRWRPLGWLGKLDSGTLKLKVAASIVAISSIHLLRIFMNAQQIDNDKIMWYVILHLTFVVSALLLGVLDRLSKDQRRTDCAPRPSAERRVEIPHHAGQEGNQDAGNGAARDVARGHQHAGALVALGGELLFVRSFACRLAAQARSTSQRIRPPMKIGVVVESGR